MAMKILIINDDGINCEGIKILAEFAKTLGEVTVVAPLKEQSGKSQSVNFRDTIKIEKFDFLEGTEAYVVDSTPADCARYGIVGLNRSYDLVLSGINKGYNLGNDILYSGTAAATFESNARGMKAIAFSTVHNDYTSAKENLKAVYDFITENNLLDYNGIYNVNIPLNPKGIKITRKTGFYYNELFIREENGEYRQTTDFVPNFGNDLSIDVDAVMNGYISVTPLTIDRTDLASFNKLKALNDK